jgi:outer membrane protein assembly factor BamB
VELRHRRGALTLANGVLYVAGGTSSLSFVFALNASTGALLWNSATGDNVDTTPAVANGVVYVGSYNGNVYALNASTGTLLWSYSTGTFVESSPAVANGVVYVGSGVGTVNGNVYALNASTGALLWSYTSGSDSVLSSPTVANGMLYVGWGYPGNLYAFGLK